MTAVVASAREHLGERPGVLAGGAEPLLEGDALRTAAASRSCWARSCSSALTRASGTSSSTSSARAVRGALDELLAGLAEADGVELGALLRPPLLDRLELVDVLLAPTRR